MSTKTWLEAPGYRNQITIKTDALAYSLLQCLSENGSEIKTLNLYAVLQRCKNQNFSEVINNKEMNQVIPGKC